MFGDKKRNNENRKFSVCQKSNGIFQHKKGISPLIATVLIVGFVIALSAIFWTFFSNTVKEQMDKQGLDTEGKSKCLNVDVSAVECKAGTGTISMKNAGKQNLAGFMFRYPMNGDTTVFTEQVELSAGDQVDYAPAGMEQTAGEGEAIPLVAAKGYAFLCGDQKVSFRCT